MVNKNTMMRVKSVMMTTLLLIMAMLMIICQYGDSGTIARLMLTMTATMGFVRRAPPPFAFLLLRSSVLLPLRRFLILHFPCASVYLVLRLSASAVLLVVRFSASEFFSAVIASCCPACLLPRFLSQRFSAFSARLFACAFPVFSRSPGLLLRSCFCACPLLSFSAVPVSSAPLFCFGAGLCPLRIAAAPWSRPSHFFYCGC